MQNYDILQNGIQREVADSLEHSAEQGNSGHEIGWRRGREAAKARRGSKDCCAQKEACEQGAVVTKSSEHRFISYFKISRSLDSRHATVTNRSIGHRSVPRHLFKLYVNLCFPFCTLCFMCIQNIFPRRYTIHSFDYQLMLWNIGEAHFDITFSWYINLFQVSR